MIDIDKLILEARKSKNQIELTAYQNIKVEIQKNQTAKGAKPLDDNSQILIIQRYSKSLEDAILQFSEAHRDDLVASYTSELKVVKKLLPEPVNASQVCSELRRWAVQNEFGTMPDFDEGLEFNIQLPKKEMGAAIKYLKSKFPTADGKMISEIVKEYIV